jgi:hypothetical protein
MPPQLAKRLHLHHLGIFLFTEKRRKKGSYLVLLAVFFGFHVFLTGVFLVEQCLERETDTKHLLLWILHYKGGPSGTKGFNDFTLP